MRIAFISQQFDTVRGGSSLFGDIFRIIGNRHDITVFTLEDRYAERNWKTVRVRSGSSFRFPWLAAQRFSAAAVETVSAAHADKPFDLVVINQTIGAPLRALKNLGVPVIYVIHHPVTVDRELALSESGGIAERFTWLLRYGHMVRTQRKLARTFPVLTVSHTAAHRIAGDYGISESGIRVILDGVDTEFFRKTLPTEPKTVLTLGSYQHPRRGFDYMLKVYRALSERGYTILDAGRRTDEQDIPLRAISGVKSLGLIATREEIRDLYSRASVFLSTSLYEGFGLSVAEALACGTPVVAFDSGGVRELLSAVDGRMLCPVRDTDRMVALAERYAAGDTQSEQDRRRAVVAARFSLTRMAGEYESYFTALTQV